MAQYFLESSAWLKKYKRSEKGSAWINQLFDGSNELFCLDLAEVEVRKVFFRLFRYPQVTEGDVQINQKEFETLVSFFESDLEKMRVLQADQTVIRKTGEILEKKWLKSVFDLVHLAGYLVAKEKNQDLVFVCSDQRSGLVDAARAFVGDKDVIVPEER